MAARSRYIATILLVLVALGGAGLAVAADRQQTATDRPEVTWAADNAAKPWLAIAKTDMSALSSDVTDLAKAGRLTLGNVQALNFDAVRTALEDGDAATDAIAADLIKLTDDQRVASRTIDRRRLGPTTGAQLDAITKAITSAANVPGAWARIRTRATNVNALIDDLQRHDGLVFRGTTSGTQGNWADAISTLAEAGTALDAARASRDNLGPGATVDTLDQLIARYAAYDSALSALYEYLGSGGEQSGDDFAALNKAVADAQRALPGGNAVFSLIVGEAAGTELTDALVEIEQARGDINDALDGSSGESQ